jgi:hypothetical protein
MTLRARFIVMAERAFIHIAILAVLFLPYCFPGGCFSMILRRSFRGMTFYTKIVSVAGDTRKRVFKRAFFMGFFFKLYGVIFW